MKPDLDIGLFTRKRVRLVRQAEMAECGLAALTMVANYHGLDIDIGSVRRRFAPSLRGSDLKSLISVADAIGLGARAVKVPLEQLHHLDGPAILHWNMHHFVVLDSVRGGKALIHDPEGWSRWMPLAEVSNHYTGIALELRPLDRFEAGDARSTLRLSQLWSRMSGLKRAVLQTLVLTVVMQVFVLASPYYMQIALDSALPALDRDLLAVLALGFALFALFNALASLLRGFVLLSAGASLSFGISINVARRLFRLPIAWFEKRHVGDVLSRFQSILPIRQFLTQDAVAAVLDGSLAVLTLVLMFVYSPRLAMVPVLAFLAYAAVRLVTFPAQRRAQEDSMVLAAREQSTMIETVRGIVTLRLFNREAERHAVWQTRLNDATNAGISFSRIGLWQGGAHTLIFALETVVTIWLAVSMLIEGGFSTGMVFAYMAYRTQFIQKSVALVDQGAAFRMLALHLERLSDIALTPEDRAFDAPRGSAAVLNGHIELRGVGFRYSPQDPWIFRGLNLTVTPGEHLAIQGPSGGGKSTLAKLILGLVEPGEGEIFVDGAPLTEFGLKRFHDQVGAVLQEDHLFAGSLADNIALFDDTPDRAAIDAAARTAQIHGDIEQMPMGYDTLVGDMGSVLSGGQKQRVLLARALYRAPKLLVMDEATSHLDGDRERAVVAAIAAMGITRITIAHRMETLQSASRVVSLRGGILTVDGAEQESARVSTPA